jgi:hypothetical protein
MTPTSSTPILTGPPDDLDPDDLTNEPNTDTGDELIDNQLTDEKLAGDELADDDFEPTDSNSESIEPDDDNPADNSAERGPARKRVLPVWAIALLGLTGLGIIILGVFLATSTTQPTVADKSDGGASALAPPEARPQPLDPRQKYDKYGYDGANLSPNLSAVDRQAASGTQLLTGKDPSVSRGSNEHLTEADLRAVSPATGNASGYRTAGEQKATRRSQLNRQFDHQQAEREGIYKTMRRSPKSREQLADERADQRERDLDHRTAQTLLRQVELANQRMGNGPVTGSGAINDPDAPNMADYNRLKAMHGGQLPPSYQTYFAREIAADRTGSVPGAVSGSTGAVTTILPTGTRKAMNLGSSEMGNGFYGLTQPGIVAPMTGSARHSSIAAVIHGDGGAIKVRNGGSLKIRLLEETRLIVKGETLVLPAHTLLTGTCSISTDRLRVSVNTLRVGTTIYPITLTVYDIDGLAGLSVPGLADKNRLAQGLAQTGQQAISSPAYFIPQGSFGQQMGGQLAMQTTNTLFQGVRSLAQAKLTATQVTIKPNYRIFLKSEASANAGVGSDFSQN